MKFCSLVLSCIFFINSAWGQSLHSDYNAPSGYQVKFEQQVMKFVGLWNQSATFLQLLDQIKMDKESKSFLSDLIKRSQFKGFRPPALSFNSKKNKIEFKQKEEVWPMYFLSNYPTIVLYDGNTVKEFNSHFRIQDLYKTEILEWEKSLKSKKKTSLLFLNYIINNVYADAPEVSPYSNYNQQVAEQNKADKKAMKGPKKFAKNVVMIFFGALFGFWALGNILNFAGGYIPFTPIGSSGTEKFNNKRDESFIKYPEIDKVVVQEDSEVDIQSFSCWGIGLNLYGANTVRYKIKKSNEDEESKDQRLNFTLNRSEVSAEMQGNTKLGKKLKKVDECCKHYKCEEWLKNRLKAENKDMEPEEYLEKIRPNNKSIK